MSSSEKTDEALPTSSEYEASSSPCERPSANPYRYQYLSKNISIRPGPSRKRIKNKSAKLQPPTLGTEERTVVEKRREGASVCF